MLQLDYAQTRYAHRRGGTPYMTGLAFVIILHAIFITALINALGDIDRPVPRGTRVTDVSIPDELRTALPPPPAPAKIRPPLPQAPPLPTVTISPPQGPRDPITLPNSISSLPTPLVPFISEIPPRAIAGTQIGPTYPALSRRLTEQGSVRLRLTIGIDGSVINASVIRSSGFQRLDEAATNWVRRNWRYEPAMRGDMPIQATTEATLTFRLQ